MMISPETLAQTEGDYEARLNSLRATIAEQQARIAELEKDAFRYRFIRKECMFEPRYVVVHVSTPAPAWETVRTPRELDESIDHFIGRVKGETK